MEKYCVYALLNPLQDGKIFYIGKATWHIQDGFKHRYYGHIASTRNGKYSKVNNKIRKILRHGLVVGHVVLSQWEQEEDALAEERQMIAAIGLSKLTNIIEGGRGYCLPEATKNKISKANKGRKYSKEIRKRMSERMMGHISPMKGKKHTEAAKRKMAIASSILHKGRKHSSEHCMAIAIANTGKKVSAETKQKLSLINTGKKLNEITKQKISEANKGRVVSEETKRKISIANTGKKRTEEFCKQISERVKKYRPTPETKIKIGLASRGNHYALGHKHTPETLAKISDASKKLWERRKKENWRFPENLNKMRLIRKIISRTRRKLITASIGSNYADTA